MIQTLNIIKFIYPFIMLAIFFCLYKKQYGFMKRFYWRMTMQRTARKLYMLVLLALLIFLNWCCFETAPGYAVLGTALVTCSLLSYRVADAVLHRLHENKRLLAVTLLLSLANYAIPELNTPFMPLFTVSVASVFYPSEKVLWKKSLPEYMNNRQSLAEMIMANYY